MSPAPTWPASAASSCRSCHAAIVWIITRPGARHMPIDPHPDPAGNVLVDRARLAGVVLSAGALESLRMAGDLTDDGLNGDPLYLSHFVTCPHAKTHRRR